MDPLTYTHDNSMSVPVTPVTVVAVPADGARLVEVWGQVYGDIGTVTFTMAGATPVPASPPGFTVPASPDGTPFQFSYPEAGAINAIASPVPLATTLKFRTTTTRNPNSSFSADAFLASLTASLSDSQLAATKILYESLQSAGILARHSSGGVYIWLAGNEVDALRNWAGGPSLMTIASPLFTPWSGFSFDGASQALRTQVMMPVSGMQDDHTLGVYSDSTTVIGPNKIAGGCGSISIGSNRTEKCSAVRSSSATSDVVNFNGMGGLQMVTRTSPEYFIATRNEIDIPVKRVSVASKSREVYFGAIGGASMPINFCPLDLKAGLFGPSLTRQQREAFRVAFQVFKNSVEAR